MNNSALSISVYELNRRLSNAVASAPDVKGVWVVAETSDLRTSGGHCYLELVEKNEQGATVSKIRATIWSGTFRHLNALFKSVTQSDITSGMKIRACVTASYHPAYGMAVNITEIDPAYTLGDAMRLRSEILQRLTADGIIENNRRLAVSVAPTRIAVVSAKGAAGYGDFITHLFTNTGLLRFSVDLYEAVMQGDRTVPTVLEALKSISAKADDYDMVVIIRGGGATTDLAAFDNYDLAAAVANFPLPVIVGIGHERDVTVLDYVAMMRVKTPTAAAEWLIERVTRLLNALGRAADRIYQCASEQIASNREMLAHVSALIPGYANRSLSASKVTLDRATDTLITLGTRNMERATQKLTQAEMLLRALSPEAVLARGFTITTLSDGTVVRSAAQVQKGTDLTTRTAEGVIYSVTK